MNFLCTSGMARLTEHSNAAVLILLCIALEAVNCFFFTVLSKAGEDFS